MLSGEGSKTGTPNDCFLKYFENTLVAIHKVLLALSKCILSGALKFASQCSAILEELESFEITRNSELFSRKF